MSNPIMRWAEQLIAHLDDEETYTKLCDKMEEVLTPEEYDTVYDRVYAVKAKHYA
jgi:hypothetical protein